MKYSFQKIVIGLILFLTFCTGILFFRSQKEAEITKSDSDDRAEIELITFGEWTPLGRKSVLLEVESEADTDINSEVSSQVDKVLVQVGDSVQKGQNLILLDRTFESAQVQYENALRQLESTKLSAQSSINNAALAVENARNDLEQTQREAQSGFEELTDRLSTQTQNVENDFLQALDLMDQWMGVSPKYQSDINAGRIAIGGRDSKAKGDFLNALEKLIRDKEALSIPPLARDLSSLTSYAKSRLNYAKQLQNQFTQFEVLTRGAVLGQDFGTTQLQALLSSINQIRVALSNDILALEGTLKQTQSGSERKNSLVLNAENRLKNAESQLELARSTSENQITAAQNQVQLQKSTQKELTIKAPFSGIITEIKVNPGEQVSLGTPLLHITNPQAPKKAIAFLTQQEWKGLSEGGALEADFENEKVSVLFRSGAQNLNPFTQKSRAEFYFESEDAAQNIVVGQIGRLKLPTLGQNDRLIPFSSVSFEPEGAEVLVINDEGILERRSLVTGNIISDALEVISGLTKGEKLVLFRKSAYTGQKVKPLP